MASIYSEKVLNWQLRLDYTYTQDIVANTSTVTSTLYVYNDNRANNSYVNDAYYEINGNRTYATFDYGNTKEWHQLGSRTDKVNHNADGTGSISLSGKWYSGIIGSSYTPSQLTIAAQPITLPTIARASQFTASEYSGNIGSSIVIKFTVASSSFTHKLYYKIGSAAETAIDTNIAANKTQVTWALPDSFYTKCPNAKYVSGNLYLYTYSGSTLIGQKATASFKANCVESACKPSVSIALAESNSTINALTNFATSKNVVKGYSQLTATVTATAQKSATIKGTTITYAGNTQDYSAAVTYTNLTATSISTTTTDSRGYTATAKDSSIHILEYFTPTITCAVTMLLDSTDTSKAIATITSTSNYWTGNFGAISNNVTTQYRYKLDTAASFGSWTTYTGGSATVSGLDANGVYIFQTCIRDKIQTSRVGSNQVRATAKPVFDFDSNDFQFNVDVNANNALTVKNCPVITTGGHTAEIPANANLNNYRAAGVYSCPASANAKTLTNTPWGNASSSAIAFVMFVWFSVGATTNTSAYSYIVQELRTYDGEAVYKRRIYTNGTANSWNYDSWNLVEAPLVDRIIETGTSGEFYYNKWSSGKSEFWGIKELTIDCDVAMGTLYSSQVQSITFPTGLFTGGPATTLTAHTTTQGAGLQTFPVFCSLYNSYSGRIRYYVYSCREWVSQTVMIHIHAIGRWK